MEPNEPFFEELSGDLFEPIPEEKLMGDFLVGTTQQTSTVTPNQDNHTDTVQDT